MGRVSLIRGRKGELIHKVLEKSERVKGEGRVFPILRGPIARGWSSSKRVARRGKVKGKKKRIIQSKNAKFLKKGKKMQR